MCRLTLALTLPFALLTLGCENLRESTRRAWWDLRLVALAPVQIPLQVAEESGEDLVSPPWVLSQAKALTWTPVFTLCRHAVYTLFYAVDLVAYPLYLPFGAEPFKLYETDSFPLPLDEGQEAHFWNIIGTAGQVSVVGVYKGAMVAGLIILHTLTLGLLL